MMAPAPIALFVYHRPAATRKVLASLQACAGFDQCELTVFADGPRNAADAVDVAATREVVRSARLPNVRLVEQPENRGLAASVIAGVTELCRARGAAIVVEDDLVLAPGFLEFMNRALARYEHEPQVFQVNGYMYPVTLPPTPADAVFMPFVGSWGWATWQRAWERFDPAATASARLFADRETTRRFDLDGAYPFARMLRRQLRGEIDSWAIRFYLSMFDAGGVALFPRRALASSVETARGTHNRWVDGRLFAEPFAGSLDQLPSAVGVDPMALQAVAAFLRGYQNPVRKVLRRIRGLLAGPPDA